MKKRTNKQAAIFPLLLFLTLLVALPSAIATFQPVTASGTPLPTETQAPEQPETSGTEAPDTQAPDAQLPDKTADETNAVPDAGSTSAGTPESQETPAAPLTQEELFADTLFIGDSRTVGLSEYAGLDTATFFCNVGMSVYSVFDSTCSVSGVGDVTLTALLESRTFSRIHLMLGINELGYDMDATVAQYAQVLANIQALQPQATIYIGANLHVDANRSSQDATFNNPRIDSFNSRIAALADGAQVRYLDVNPIFDDEAGCLRADCTGDGTHPYGSCYTQWGQWLYEQMQKVG